jgi:SEFIR domain/Yip1 domain
MNRPIVFLSYSHDSDAHRERVLALSERLRADGFETRLDRYINGTPAEGWPRWMLNQLDAANFVLVVCTETYYRRFRGHEEPGKGHGVDWEGALITNELYEARSRMVRFVPVTFAEQDAAFIPEPLQGVTRYPLLGATQYEDLCAFLSGTAGIEPGTVGPIPLKSRRRAQPLDFGDALDPTAGSATAVGRLTAYLLDFGRLCQGPKTAIVRLTGEAAGDLTRPLVMVAACVVLGFLLQLPQLRSAASFATFAGTVAIKLIGIPMIAATIHLLFRRVGGRAGFASTFSAYLYLISPLYLVVVMMDTISLGVLRAYNPGAADEARVDPSRTIANAAWVEKFMTDAPGLAVTYWLLTSALTIIGIGWFIVCWGAFRELHGVTRWRSTLAGIGTLIAGLIFGLAMKLMVSNMFNSDLPPLR